MPKFLRPTEKIGIAENERVRKKHFKCLETERAKIDSVFLLARLHFDNGREREKKDKKSCKKATYEDFYYCKFLP